jgi:maleylpyruvate isomerase
MKLHTYWRSSSAYRVRIAPGTKGVGDEVSIADVLLVPQLYAARRVGVSPDLLPALSRVEAECLKLEGFATAHPDRQADRE